jgi:hypothetical protein
MLTSIFHILPQPQKVNTSTGSQRRSQLFPNTSFAVALISHIIQKGIFNRELSTSKRTARLVKMQKNYVLYSTASSPVFTWTKYC